MLRNNVYEKGKMTMKCEKGCGNLMKLLIKISNKRIEILIKILFLHNIEFIFIIK